MAKSFFTSPGIKAQFKEFKNEFNSHHSHHNDYINYVEEWVARSSFPNPKSVSADLFFQFSKMKLMDINHLYVVSTVN